MEIRIRKYQKDDLIRCTKMVRETYMKCCFSDGTKQASREYMDMYDTDRNLDFAKKMMEMSKIFFVATVDGQIIGLVRGSKERIRGLYVDYRYHRKGVGRALLKKFEKEAYREGSREIRIRGSLYAIPFYQEEGYKKTTGIRSMGGVKIQPMKKILS
ncbi:MAG: GNAT family N-acetyltransferase [Candidatus Pacebacteria bacterium]|nr:GNAT family N-acetyltransferase [Candidatus Paceibacterota bacterium]